MEFETENNNDIDNIFENKRKCKTEVVNDSAKRRKTDINHNSNIGNLLHAYTYFLNDMDTKHVSIGFKADTFEPITKIHGDKKNIILSCNDWFGLYLHIKENMMEMFYEFKINKQLSLKVNDVGAVIQYLKTKISLNYEEWIMFSNIIEFLHQVFVHNYAHGTFIKTYYNIYLNNCIDDGVSRHHFDYFTDTPITKMFNTSRLFYEIPTLSNSKLNIDIELNRIVKAVVQNE